MSKRLKSSCSLIQKLLNYTSEDPAKKNHKSVVVQNKNLPKSVEKYVWFKVFDYCEWKEFINLNTALGNQKIGWLNEYYDHHKNMHASTMLTHSLSLKLNTMIRNEPERLWQQKSRKTKLTENFITYTYITSCLTIFTSMILLTLSMTIAKDYGIPIEYHHYRNLLTLTAIAGIAQSHTEEKYFKSKNDYVLNRDFSTLPPISNDTKKLSHQHLIGNLMDKNEKVTIKTMRERVTLFQQKASEEEKEHRDFHTTTPKLT